MGRDARGAYRYLRLLLTVWWYERLDLTVPQVFQRTVRRHPDRVCLHFEEESWTFGQLDRYSNRVAQLLVSQGFSHGDSLGLFMENRPEYIGLWLGAAKVGVVPALINYNLRGQSLVHGIQACGSRGVILGTELVPAVLEVLPQLGPEVKLFTQGMWSNGVRLPQVGEVEP